MFHNSLRKSVLLLVSIAGCAGFRQIATAQSPGLAAAGVALKKTQKQPLSSADGREAEGTTQADLEEARERWLAGAADAAKDFGCAPDIIVQLPGETLADVVQLYALTAHEGSCLVLQPVSGDPAEMRYSLASGGQVDGVDILYISDVSRIRIWDGMPTAGD